MRSHKAPLLLVVLAALLTFPAACKPTCPSGWVLDDGLCLPLEVKIAAGTFTMGSPIDEPGRDYDEHQHQVTLTHGFLIWKYEVTREIYKALMKVDPSAGSPRDYKRKIPANSPVERVTWDDALNFCNALSRRSGLPECFDCSARTDWGAPSCTLRPEYQGRQGSDYYTCKEYRLPTEAEWEYAYRAGTRTALYNGALSSVGGKDPKLTAIAWYRGNPVDGGVVERQPVGVKAPNPWGLYDMAGNVGEWVWDWYGPYPAGAVTDPVGPETGEQRVVRGGSFASYPRICRGANRYTGQVTGSSRKNIDPQIGFRPVRTLH